MPSELTRLRLEHNLKAADIVEVVKRYYPSFDKTMLSKCERGEKYGVNIKPEIMNAIINELAPESRESIKRRIRGGHRLLHRVQARLENDDYELLQQLREREGYKTLQDLLSDLIKNYIKGAKNDD